MPFNACSNGHYFDSSKNTDCPFCSAIVPEAIVEDKPIQPPEPVKATVSALTVFDPPVGWLVAMNGPGQGQDFTLRGGSNKIIAGPQMPAVTQGELGALQELQATVVYDERSNRFLLRSGGGSASMRHNGEPLSEVAMLKAGDRIKVGQTMLLFIPLAGDNFRWS